MYNCVLDACVYAGDPARFRVLTTTMREKFGRLDIGFLQHHAEKTYFGWRDIRCSPSLSGITRSLTRTPPHKDKYDQYCRKCWPHTSPPVPEVSEDGSVSSASSSSSGA